MIDWTAPLRLVGPPHSRVTVYSMGDTIRVIKHDNAPMGFAVDLDGCDAEHRQLVENVPAASDADRVIERWAVVHDGLSLARGEREYRIDAVLPTRAAALRLQAAMGDASSCIARVLIEVSSPMPARHSRASLQPLSNGD